MAEAETHPPFDTGDRVRAVLVCLSLIAAYVAVGRLGLLLAVPPGYATAIFPPAGIAAAAMVIGGRRTLPAIFLGSLLLNMWVGYALAGDGAARAVAAAMTIAAASTLQAAVVGGALRRAIGYPMALDTGKDLLRFLALPPVCCLTSATLSVAGLWALGLVGDAALFRNWVTWWVGDTLGVLVIVPLLMVLAGEPRPLWRSRAWPVALPMLLFFAFFVAVFIRVSAWENDQSLLEFRLESQQSVDRIRTRLEEQEIFLGQLQGALAREAELSGSTFRQLVQGILQRFPMVRAVAWAPHVPGNERARFEAARQADAPGYQIRELDAGGSARPAGADPEYYPIAYVEPRAGNEGTLGFDLLSDPARGPAVRQALAGNAMITTTPIPLPGQPNQTGGLLVMTPIADAASGPGVLLAKLQIGTFIDGMLASMHGDLRLRLVDLATGGALFDDFATARETPFYRQEFAFGERRYEVLTAPSPRYLGQHRGWQSWVLLAVGVLATGLLGALLMLGTGYTSRIERQVEARTADLAAANSLLRVEIDERRNAETALRHAQRMEAIGQLTGGIAHDFNNLLTVISANAELMRNAAHGDAAALRRAGGILRAAERGERLTRQLLAFSRRQNLRPEPIDLRLRTADMADMLSRSTRPDIEVSVEMPDDLWPVSVDPAEFELAVLNIAVNARDVMPNGGQLGITACNITIPAAEPLPGGQAGEFVALSISDTGEGMAPETLARAFEPYFTTKEVGAGSGLGLSQVYGFVTQSGGHAAIRSEPGRGTAVTLYLPRAATAPAADAPPANREATAQEIRVLVVEDEPEIAELTAAMLRDLGHEPVLARDAASAWAVLAAEPAIGLVISDIVMPGETNGLQLARALRAQRPNLPVLLVTGYNQYGPEVAREAFDLLEKPYRQDTLANAVRSALERRTGRPRPPSGSAAAAQLC